MSDWYVATGAPANESSLTSATMRSEFQAIQAAMAKLPDYTGNGGKIVQVNAGGTALQAITTTALAALLSGIPFTVDDANASAVTEALTIEHTTTGTPATGIGVSLGFSVETSPGNNEKGMTLAAVTTDVTGASEDFDFVVNLMAGGATAAEKFRVTSTGAVVMQGGSITDASGAISFGNENLSTTGTFASGAATLATLAVTGATALNGDTTVGNATGDALTFHPSAWTLSNAVTITGTWADLGTVTTVDINGGTIDGTTQSTGTINGPIAAGGTWTAAATWTLPSVTLSGTVSGTPTWASTQAVNISGSAPAGSLTGTTLAANVVSSSLTSLGTITSLVATTADINGGTIDGTVIGGSTPAAITGTAGTFTGAFTISTANGVDVNPGSDIDADLLTVGVTGTPRFFWDETNDWFGFNKNVAATSQLNFVPGAGNDASFVNRSAGGFRFYPNGGTGAYSLLLATNGETRIAGNTIVGSTSVAPFALLSVYSGASGATPTGAADDIVISHSASAGISVLTPNNETGYLVFGDPENAAVGFIEYNHATDAMTLRSAGVTQLATSGAAGAQLTTVERDLYVKNAAFVGTQTDPYNDVLVVGGGGITHLSNQFNVAAGTTGVTQYEFVNRVGGGFDFYVNDAAALVRITAARVVQAADFEIV